MATRVCRKCGEAKPLDEAHWYREGKDRDYRRTCKACMQAAARTRKRAVTGRGVPARTMHRCGHPVDVDASPTYKRFAAQDDCPSCAAGLSPRKDDVPGKDLLPEPKMPQPDAAWIAAKEALLPDGVPFHYALPKLLLMLEAGEPVWMQGPSGTSKSTTGKQAAAALGLPFYRTQVNPKMSEAALFGWIDAGGTVHRSEFWNAFEHGGVFMLDECDNGNQALLAGLNSAIANGFTTFAGEHAVNRHPDFRAIATANTAGLGPEANFLGRTGVDMATRDRFITLHVPIDERLERALFDVYAPNPDARVLAKHGKAARKAARGVLEEHAMNRLDVPDGDTVCAEVRRVRAAVEDRFDGTVVTPRATISAARLLDQGFTLREILSAKLVGLSSDQAESVLGVQV